jgi:V/A-type H+-transporting ATPase subunit I
MIPIILNEAEPMVKVRVITVKDDSEKALKTLHRLGVLHVEESDELEPIDKAAIGQQRREVSELAKCIDNLLAYLPEAERVSLGEGIEVIYIRPFNELDTEIRSLAHRLNSLYQRTVGPNEELKRLRELKGHLELLAQQTDLKLRDLNFSGEYLFARVFVLPSKVLENLYDTLKDYLFISTLAPGKDETVLHVIAKAQDQRVIESVIADAGGKVVQLPDGDLTLWEFLEVAEDNIHSLEEDLAKLNEELRSKVAENLERIVLLQGVLAAENERLSVLEKACEAKYVTLTAGWIPESNIESTISEVKDSVEYAFIDTRKPEPQEEPPTKLNNPYGLKPFQVITSLFGAPKYSEWDPTPIIAYSFAAFFGLMLCDVVYAIGIILAARFILRIFTDDPNTEGFKLFQRVLYISSAVALVFGLLTGTYLGDIYHFFGIESLAIVESVKEVLSDPISFIVLALALGVIHVNIAHVLAMMKGWKERQKGVVINKIGLLALQLFGIPLILRWLFDVSLPVSAGVYSIFMYIVIASVVVIIVSSFMQRGGLGAIFWFFDITGLLGDVMSYCRLAGVGLATFYLASSFNMLAELLSGMIPGVVGMVVGGLMAIVVLIFGHTINLILSGLTAFIHSLRLCFVEFLFKFYEGSGREYSPFKLKTTAPVIVGGK